MSPVILLAQWVRILQSGQYSSSTAFLVSSRMKLGKLPRSQHLEDLWCCNTSIVYMMSTAPEPSGVPESRQNSTRLQRDDRIRVLALRDAGLTYQQIASQLQMTLRQVQYTCQSQQTTPKKARGQKPKLSEDDIDKIIEFISSSKRNRHMPYYKVIQELDLPVGTTALSRALKKRGYTRCEALREPPLSDSGN